MSKLKVEKVNRNKYILERHPLFVLDELLEGKIGAIKGWLEGKILTIIDASIQDNEQRKALKDIIREAVWSPEYHTNDVRDIIAEFAYKFSKDNCLNDDQKYIAYYGRNKEKMGEPENYFTSQ